MIHVFAETDKKEKKYGKMGREGRFLADGLLRGGTI
jgi:hypothetical protein